LQSNGTAEVLTYAVTLDPALGWGTVLGVVCAPPIALQSSCHVESDVQRLSLAIKQGAHFHRHSWRAKSEADLVAALEGRNFTPATTLAE
jgi:hypothetical protein